MKICIVLTSRGNYAKFKRVIELFRAEKLMSDMPLELSVIIGGELVLFDRIAESAFDIDHDYKVFFSIAGDSVVSMAKSVGAATCELSSLFNAIQPDIVCIVGDRFETLGVATAAYMHNIPIAHLEGGELSGSLDEGVRHAITKLSSLHFPCTEKAGKIIEQLGEDPENIHVVGSTSLDQFDDIADHAEIVELQKKSGSGPILDVNAPFLVVVLHPVPNELEKIREQTYNTLWAIDDVNLPTFWINPNLDAGHDSVGSAIRQYRDMNDPYYVHFFKSLPIREYGFLLKNAACVVGNSSAGIRECSYLGTQAVNIGSRQNHRERGANVIDVDFDFKAISEAIQRQLGAAHFPNTLYGDGKASEKIVRIIKQSDLKRQKVFYEGSWHYSGEGREQGASEQEHQDVGGKTTLSMGVGHGDSIKTVQYNHCEYGYRVDSKGQAKPIGH